MQDQKHGVDELQIWVSKRANRHALAWACSTVGAEATRHEAFQGVADPEQVARRLLAAAATPWPLRRSASLKQEVPHLLASGLPHRGDRHSAHALGSDGQVSVSRLPGKLNLRERVQAPIFSYEHGVVDVSG